MTPVKCPRCKRGEMRQVVTVYVDAPVHCHDLSKTGLRSGDVKVVGVGWDSAWWYCPKCGHTFRLDGKGG